MQQSALAMIEFKSIARGIFTTDAIAKKAPVKILSSNPVCPGKYLVIFAGEVADVEESWRAGLLTGSDLIINDLFLPHVHEEVIPAMTASNKVDKFGAIGVIETFSVASCILAADKAAKMSQARLVEIRLANGLGGKAYFTMTGDLPDVEASIFEARNLIKNDGVLAGCEIIQNPHPDLLAKGVYW